MQQQMALLQLMTRSNMDKSSLRSGAQYVNRGGLTFMQSSFLPWLHAAEASMKEFLNQSGYRKYGKDDIFTITKAAVVEDLNLLSKF